MKKTIFTYLVLLSCVLIATSSMCMGFEVSLGMWHQDPSGYFSYKGDNLSIKDNLKYDIEDKLMARAKFDMPLLIPNIYFMYTPIDFDGTGIKDVNFRFGDITFQGNIPFYSEVKLDQYDVALYYGIPFLNTLSAGILNVDAGINLKVVDFYGEVKQDQTGLSESKSATIPIPMIFLAMSANPINLISIEAEGRGIAYSGNAYFDLIGRIKIHPFGPLFISGGYRYEKIKIDYSDIDADIEIKGPFVEAGVVF